MDSITIGKFEITPLDLGAFRLDGGAMMGVVPKVIWEKVHPCDELNRIDLTARCPLIRVDNRVILVDNGVGPNRHPKFKNMFAFNEKDNYLDEALAKLGLERSDVTDVILTHLHFDHAGGSTMDKDSNPKPSFPNARYYIQKRQLKHARVRMERDRASYLPEDFEPLFKAGQAQIVDGRWELLPGFVSFLVEGHTPAMQLPRIQEAGQTLLYIADLLPFATHLSLPWIMSYDLHPMTTLDEKRRILRQTADADWTLMFEHDPKVATGKVKMGEKGFELV